MAVLAALRRLGKSLHADVDESTTRIALEVTLAKRETLGALRQLRYRVQLDVEEDERTVYFSETLWERTPVPRGAVELAPNLATKEETFRIQDIPRGPGGLEDQLVLFEKRYGERFDFTGIRQRLKETCAAEGYELKHLVPV